MASSLFRLLARKISSTTVVTASAAFGGGVGGLARGVSTTTSVVSGKRLSSEPISPNDLHRAGGIASFMRVPIAEPPKSEGDLDVAILGIPLDTATSNRPGARYVVYYLYTMEHVYTFFLAIFLV